MQVKIGGQTFTAGSSPQLANRFPGDTWGAWPGTKSMPTKSMEKAIARNGESVEALFHVPGLFKGPYR